LPVSQIALVGPARCRILFQQRLARQQHVGIDKQAKHKLGKRLIDDTNGNFYPTVDLPAGTGCVVSNRIEFSKPQGHDPDPINTEILHKVVFNAGCPPF
jgi:hypothetical protein